jgi:hypothetical protein
MRGGRNVENQNIERSEHRKYFVRMIRTSKDQNIERSERRKFEKDQNVENLKRIRTSKI